MVSLRPAGTKALDHGLPEGPGTAAHIEDHVFLTTGLDLHTARMPAKRPAHREAQTIDIGLDLGTVSEALPCALSSAAIQFFRTSAVVSDTGIEPRVPQNKSFILPKQPQQHQPGRTG